MGSVFSGAIGGPWCYMEFGNVRWCETRRSWTRDWRRRLAGIATKERATIGSQSAELLSAAHTNGELFLALAANGPQRNSINGSGSLFNVLCGGSEEPCQGPTAARRSFAPEAGLCGVSLGLFLFWIGVLGMVLLLGFIALRLLGAAIFSLFLLLLAPAAVIAPALGDGGRASFRSWATRLLGAVCSKLIYSFLLGVVLLMQRTLLGFSAFGWAAQWLFVSAMWWGLFIKRHQRARLRPRQHRRGALHGSLRHVRRARERDCRTHQRWCPVRNGSKQAAHAAAERGAAAQAGAGGSRAGERDHGRTGGARTGARVRRCPGARAGGAGDRSADIGKATQLERCRASTPPRRQPRRGSSSAREAALTDRKVRSPPEREREAARFAAEEQSQAACREVAGAHGSSAGRDRG